MKNSKPHISIEYCPKCHWLLRSAYFAQEILTSFVDYAGGVELIPSEITGRFIIKVDEEEIWDRKRNGGFPEITKLKQLIRDKIAPNLSLGHSDVKH